MAGEPSIEAIGYAGDIKDFQNGSILNISVHPGYTDKTTNQWKDLEPLFFGVRPLTNQARDGLEQVRDAKRQPDMSVRVLVNGSLSKSVSEKDGKRYENWNISARTIAVLSVRPKKQFQAGSQPPAPPQQGYQQGYQQPSRQQADPWGGGNGGWDASQI